MLHTLKKFLGFARPLGFGSQVNGGVIPPNQEILNFDFNLFLAALAFGKIFIQLGYISECYAVRARKYGSRVINLYVKPALRTKRQESFAREERVPCCYRTNLFLKNLFYRNLILKMPLFLKGRSTEFGETRQGSQRVDKTPRMAQMMN